MNRQDTVLRLILVEESTDAAEQLVSQLRNGGIAARPSRAENEAQLEEAIADQPDLILFNLATTSIPLPATAAAAARSGRDIALVAYALSPSADQIADAFRDGARALAVCDRPDHMQTIIAREFEALKMRRSVRRLEAALRESERRCDSLLDSSRDPIAYVHEGMHVRANKAYLDIFGFEEFEDIEGMSILDLIAAEDAGDFKALLRRLSKGEKPPQRLNLKAQRSDGSIFDAVMEFSEATYEGEPCQQIVFRQQALDPNLAQQIDELRSKDLVTDLYNRQHTLTEIERAAASAAAGQSDQALLLFEPDNFKKTLDTIGLGLTDLLLGDMASLLRRHLGESDVAGRLSDQNFGVLLTGRPADQVRQLAETLRHAFEDRIFEVGKQSVTLTMSIGGALITEKNAHADQILNQAQAMLRMAQGEGGNRVSLLDPGAQDKAEVEKNQRWLRLIKDALANDGFLFHYQPVVSLHGSGKAFYEILLRMKGPKGDITPEHFMPIAEQNGLLPAIDRWVIANALRLGAERERQGQPTSFFIKLSAQSLDDQTLLPWIAQQLKNARQPGDSLIFEMPESLVVTHLKQARVFLKGLEQLHCRFALEQFGRGLNSFQLLKHVPAHYLKIDRSFMVDLVRSKETQDKVREICEQAHHAGKLTVAEFVEDAATMSILFSCGANFVQGNFLQEPQAQMNYEFGT